jgi:Ser/Thr protein kinase RdoA (MazF antagonist)
VNSFPTPYRAAFDFLTPDAIVAIVESCLDVRLDGTVEPFASYVNRVYGLRDENGDELVAKFYRPGRWSGDAIAAEHRFLGELAQADVPVVEPIADRDGDTLFEVDVEVSAPESEDATDAIFVAVFPKRGGRSFDAERDEDWFRLGSIVGRMHAVGRREPADARTELSIAWLAANRDRLLGDDVVHPEFRDEFAELTAEASERFTPLFSGIAAQRIHGDCHRGNIIDRPGEGLVLIDFDDMMVGPAVQDLWLLLPDHLPSCGRELTMLLDGYEQFVELDRRELELVEPLRFMRMIHFLAWRAVQRHDNWFQRDFPEWGNHAFWVREMEDLRDQLRF